MADLAGSPDPRDAVVLRHLRGFPDELRRFSNVLKQAHGKSAVSLFLSRPAPADSFLVELCRAARDGEDVVTVIEAAELLGRPPSALASEAAPPDLPPPLWGTGRHRLWRRADIRRHRGGADGARPDAESESRWRASR
jgi:hypothetical protein